MSRDRVLVFIPSYNCEKQIKRVIEQFDETTENCIDTVLIINNRSTDSTETVASEKIDQHKKISFKVLRNHENYGLGGSHKVAFQYALDHGFDYLIVLHGDDQGNIHDLLPLIKSGEFKNYDCLLGARFHPASKLHGYSRFRTFGNIVFNAFFSLVLGKRIHDLGAGLNCYDTKILKDHFYKKFPDDLTFNYCMVMAHQFYKHSIHFFPLTWREEDQVSNVKLFSQAKRVLKMLAEFFWKKGDFLNKDLRLKSFEHYKADIISENKLTA